MKRVIFMCLLCVGLTGYAQEWTKKIDDPDFHNRRNKGLKVGDPMPDISLGSVWNNKTGKTRFSDFKGKLIILDFWSGNCASCIVAFPKMEQLQKEFKDEIQIFLINPWEKVDEVIAHFKKNKEALQMPDLPCIQKDDNGNIDQIQKLLPVIAVTSQVWIDKEGKIALIGSKHNNHSEKIRDFLDGKEVYKLNNNSLNPMFDAKVPYVNLLGDFKTTPVTYSSTFTGFNNEYHAMNSREASQVIDSVAGTVRNTYVNNYVFELYHEVFVESLKESSKKILFGIGGGFHSVFSPVVVEMPKDTLRYSCLFNDKGVATKDDYEYRKPKVCYEQILAMNTPKELQKKYMLEDLNRYFGNLYGTYGRMEKRTIPCYILVKLVGNNAKVKIKKKDDGQHYKKSDIVVNGVRFRKLENYSVGGIGNDLHGNKSIKAELVKNKSQNEPSILLNETGLEMGTRIDLELPEIAAIKSMEDYRKALNKNGFDIIIAKRTLDFLVITDNSGK